MQFFWVLTAVELKGAAPRVDGGITVAIAEFFEVGENVRSDYWN